MGLFTSKEQKFRQDQIQRATDAVRAEMDKIINTNNELRAALETSKANHQHEMDMVRLEASAAVAKANKLKELAEQDGADQVEQLKKRTVKDVEFIRNDYEAKITNIEASKGFEIKRLTENYEATIKSIENKTSKILASVNAECSKEIATVREDASIQTKRLADKYEADLKALEIKFQVDLETKRAEDKLAIAEELATKDKIISELEASVYALQAQKELFEKDATATAHIKLLKASADLAAEYAKKENKLVDKYETIIASLREEVHEASRMSVEDYKELTELAMGHKEIQHEATCNVLASGALKVDQASYDALRAEISQLRADKDGLGAKVAQLNLELSGILSE